MSSPDSPKGRRFPAAIVLLGLTSLFTDWSSDMITPLMPALLVGSLGAPAAVLGAIEGAADGVAALLKYASGRLADRLPRRKPLIVAGYGIASVLRPLMGLAGSPLHVLAVRMGDRLGKGLRTAPRDALIADAAPPGQAGRAFGFHRGMDHAGAVIGPVVAALLLAAGLPLRHVFLWAALPAAAALVCVVIVKEPPRPAAAERFEPAPPERAVPPAVAAPAPARRAEPVAVMPAGDPAHRARLPPRLVSLLVIVLVFALAASTDMFVLLRAQDLGVPLAMIPLLAAGMSVVKMVLSPLAGAFSDRVGRLPLVAGGWLAYAASYAALALVSSPWAVSVVVLLYGTYHGLTEATERALVRDLAPPESRGRAYGAYNAVLGLSALPAGLVTGVIWDRVSPEAALLACAALATLATGALLAWARLSPARAPPGAA